MRKSRFKLRVAHIDIGRQMETVGFLKRFISFSADNGFNTVQLYLEGRIRTKSFPLHPVEESYSPEQMREVAAHAASLGVGIIPVVSILGCARQFLQYPETVRLAELRPPFTGRFWNTKRSMFCPSRPELWGFLEAYLAEICDIFPGEYFHAGCDETWDIGRCDLCRARMQNGESESDIFLKHLMKGYEVITKRLGRRMMVWDDMFEFYPDALERLPRDVVMVCWHYLGHADPIRGHFANHVVRDVLGEYDRLGFEYVICPAEYVNVHNVENFTGYALRRAPLGAVMAAWEKWDAYMLQSLPFMAYAGRLFASGLAGEQPELFRDVVRDVFGVDDDLFVRAVYSVFSVGFHKERKVKPEAFLTVSENDERPGRARLNEMLLLVLPGYLDRVAPAARDILLDIVLTLRSERIAREFGALVPAFFDPEADTGVLGARFGETVGRLEEVARERIAMWDRARPGIVPCRAKELYGEYLAAMRGFPALARERGCLIVRFLLPDQYCAQNVRISVRYEGADAWETVADGQMKQAEMDCYFSRIFPIDRRRVPVRVRIETKGYGGQGFTHVEAHNAAGSFAPAAVENVVGEVLHPEFVLERDRKWAWTGEIDVMKAFRDRKVADAVHGFEVVLRPAAPAEASRAAEPSSPAPRG